MTIALFSKSILALKKLLLQISWLDFWELFSQILCYEKRVRQSRFFVEDNLFDFSKSGRLIKAKFCTTISAQQFTHNSRLKKGINVFSKEH